MSHKSPRTEGMPPDLILSSLHFLSLPTFSHTGLLCFSHAHVVPVSFLPQAILCCSQVHSGFYSNVSSSWDAGDGLPDHPSKITSHALTTPLNTSVFPYHLTQLLTLLLVSSLEVRLCPSCFPEPKIWLTHRKTLNNCLSNYHTLGWHVIKRND